MMNKENTYFLTCQEVYEVLKRLPDRQLRLIPEEVIKNIEINAQKSEQEYNLKVDAMQRVILSRQARAMLMAIYSQYFLDEMTNKMLKQRLQENEQEEERNKSKNYSNRQDIFYHSKPEVDTDKKENQEIIVVEEKRGIFDRIIERIKKIFKK